MLTQNDNRTNNVNADSLIIFTSAQRVTLLVANFILFSISIIGNVSVIIVNTQRKMRHLYKYCLISLALSDLLMTTLTGIEHITTLSEEMLIWHLGTFMCKILPFVQITALITNSMTLTCIAIDRYQTIVNAFQFKWDPKPFSCYLSIAAMWIISAGVAYPMLLSYVCIDLTAVKIDKETGNVEYFDVQRCMAISKKYDAYYFGSLLIFIFLPLLITFLWLYLHVAALIWIRTRVRMPSTNDRLQENSSTESTNIDCKRFTQNNNNCSNNYCQVHNNFCMLNKHSLERKLRTFKVILILMIVFFICRLPLWIFMVIQMSMLLNQPYHWYIGYGLNLIAYSNSALNPFLYTFLNETILYGEKLFICSFKLFCNCCRINRNPNNNFVSNNSSQNENNSNF